MEITTGYSSKLYYCVLQCVVLGERVSPGSAESAERERERGPLGGPKNKKRARTEKTT